MHTEDNNEETKLGHRNSLVQGVGGSLVTAVERKCRCFGRGCTGEFVCTDGVETHSGAPCEKGSASLDADTNGQHGGIAYLATVA